MNKINWRKEFIDYSTDLMQELEAAFVEQNYKKINFLSHKLKSSFGMMNYLKEADILANIEAISEKKRSTKDLERLFSVLQKKFKAIKGIK